MRNARLYLQQFAAALTCLVLVFSAAVTMAMAVPALKGRVNDYAGLLSAATAGQLEAALQQFEQAESTQLVVLTVPSLEGDSIEDFSMRVAEKWRIGREALDNGQFCWWPARSASSGSRWATGWKGRSPI
jgi:uncharacterized protein